MHEHVSILRINTRFVRRSISLGSTSSFDLKWPIKKKKKLTIPMRADINVVSFVDV